MAIMAPISLEDTTPHLRFTLFITGSFVIAWSYDLMLYGISHVWNGENPMRDQLGFGDDDQHSPKYLPILLLQYLVVCGLAAVLSFDLSVRFEEKLWCAAAIKAVEFLPAPFFSGKLMAFLGQFSRLSDVHQVLLNLLATAFAAFLAHAAQDSTMATSRVELPKQLHRFRPILADTLGFGLGVAWNVFLMKLLAPEDMDARHIIGLFGYLMVVLVIAFRLAAMSDPTLQQPTLIQRTMDMLSFAFNVVCAFTMVAFVSALLLPGWVGDGLCLVILMLLAAVLSAAVASVDMDRTEQRQTTLLEEGGHSREYGFGTCCAMDALIFCPCVWCCCPWIPLLWILAGITPDIHVKERWQELIAFVLGLATSIQASGMLTNATNQMSTALGICGSKHCDHPWLFILLQGILAIVTTAILLPALAHVSEKVQHEDTTSDTAERSEQQTERRPLLQKVKKFLPKFSRRSSKV